MMPAHEKRTAQFKLMVRPSLHVKIKKAAKQSGRSLNEEMETRLEASFVAISREELASVVQAIARDIEQAREQVTAIENEMARVQDDFRNLLRRTMDEVQRISAKDASEENKAKELQELLRRTLEVGRQGRDMEGTK